MSSIMLVLAVVVFVGTVNLGFAQPGPDFPTGMIETCDQLPKVQFLSNQIMVTNSPFKFTNVLTPLFNCNTLMVTRPAREITGYDGTILATKGSKVIALDYTVSSDGNSIITTDCSTGANTTWYSSVTASNDNGTMFCVYICIGSSLGEYACASNNGEVFPQEDVAVAEAREVPNGQLIHPAQANCILTKGCKAY